MFSLITKESLQLQNVAACCEQFLVLYMYLVSPLFSQLSRLNQIKGSTNRKFLVHYAPSSLSYKVFTLSQTLQRAVSRTIDPATDISAIKSLQSHYDTERRHIDTIRGLWRYRSVRWFDLEYYVLDFYPRYRGNRDSDSVATLCKLSFDVVTLLDVVTIKINLF